MHVRDIRQYKRKAEVEIIAGYSNDLQAVSRGVMRGLGRQVVATIIIFIAYWLVALPIGIPLCFLTPLRMHGKALSKKYNLHLCFAIGIWIGLVIALMLTAIMYLVTINCILNFDKIAREVSYVIYEKRT